VNSAPRRLGALARRGIKMSMAGCEARLARESPLTLRPSDRSRRFSGLWMARPTKAPSRTGATRGADMNATHSDLIGLSAPRSRRSPLLAHAQMLTAKEGTFVARQLSLRRFHKDAFCRNDEVKRRPHIVMPEGSGWRCTIMAFTWFRQFRSMGVSTSSRTGSLEPSSCPCGRSGPPSRPRSHIKSSSA
jgi:hypothetical protein